jgi:hypothetical protein
MVVKIVIKERREDENRYYQKSQKVASEKQGRSFIGCQSGYEQK